MNECQGHISSPHRILGGLPLNGPVDSLTDFRPPSKPSFAPVFELVVEDYLHGVRIDSFLARHFRNYSAWRLMRIVRAGRVRIEETLVTEDQRVFTGQTVRIELVEPPDRVLESAPDEVPIRYEDPWMLIVDKPAGLIAHPTGEYQVNSLANVLQRYIDQRTPLPGLIRPGIVHRLDRQTSGLMVIALTHLAHRNLSMGFEAGRVSKSYLALTEGVVASETGSLKFPIGRAATGRHVLMSCRGDAIDPRPSTTNYEVLERFAQHTLVRATPLTGRNHQIRVHFAHIGHPLVGDEFYMAHGRFHPFRPPRDASDDDDEEPDVPPVETGLTIRRHALHACRLAFAHPITGLWMEFHSQLPKDFAASVEELRSNNLPKSPR